MATDLSALGGKNRNVTDVVQNFVLKEGFRLSVRCCRVKTSAPRRTPPPPPPKKKKKKKKNGWYVF